MEVRFKDLPLYNSDAMVPPGGSAGQVLTKESDSDYSVHWEDLSETFIVKAPIGTIVIWSGTQDNIPTGWAFCDGQDGRPDLRDKFVLGAGATHSVGEEGGSEEVTLTVAQMPSHRHDVYWRANATGFGHDGYATRADSTGSEDTGRTGPSGSSQPHPNMPPYYTLCYIIKVTADETDGPSYTAGDGMSLDGDTFSVDTPVRGIYTLAQWDALPEAERNKGAYVVSDGQPSSGGGVTTDQVNTLIDDKLNAYTPLEVYSTEDTRIGTWIDGKPLYRRVIITTVPSSGIFMTITPNPNIDTFVKVDGYWTRPGANGRKFTIFINTVAYDDNGVADYDDPNGVAGAFGADRVNALYLYGYGTAIGKPLTIILEYTKTTDQATVQTTAAIPANLTVEPAAATAVESKKVTT